MMSFHVEDECAKSGSHATATVFSSGCFSLRCLTISWYIAGSSTVLRKTHGEIFASPNLLAVSVKNKNCAPLSLGSSSFFCNVLKIGSAVPEQVGPRENNTLSTSLRRDKSAIPSCSLQASS